MNETFNTNFQNTIPNQDPTINPYQNMGVSPYQDMGGYNSPYPQGMNPLTSGMSSNNAYPMQPQQGYSSLGSYMNNASVPSFAEGGEVKKKEKKEKKEKMNPYPSLAEMIRQQGEGEDTILAHINPLEAMMLKSIGGSGTINKKTGLPQFGLFNNPGKWFKSVAGPALGTVFGNMMLPGLGGVLGGALGGAMGSKVRGRSDAGQSALRGAGIGAMTPILAGLAGSGANALGATGAGNFLTNYGNQNAILPALGLGERASNAGNAAGMGQLFGANNNGSALQNYNNRSGTSGVSAGDGYDDYVRSHLMEEGRKKNRSFTEALMENSKNYLTEPQNLLTTGILASSFLNRPKEKTPEQRASEEKRYQKALMLDAGELSKKETALLAEEQMKRRIARQKFLPEERLGNIEPVYVRTNTPEEYQRQGRWLNYYNNPQFNGNPIAMKMGGPVGPHESFQMEEMASPSGLGYYISGQTGGQEDKVPAYLSDGEYVIPADVVSHLGDGNNTAGAKKLDMGLQNIRKHKMGGGVKLPPKAKSLASYIGG